MLLLQRKEGAQGLHRKLRGPRAFALGLAVRKNVLSRTLCRTRARNVLASGSPRESLFLEEFSENRSVLFPSAVDTIPEENSSRVIQFGPHPLFDSVRHFIAKHKEISQ